MAEIETDNLDEVLDSYDGAFPSQNHTLTVANVMEYARDLHDREGFYVFNDELLQQIVRNKLEEAINAGLGLSDEVAQQALDAAGFEYVNRLLDLVGGVRPPVRPGEGTRQATRGGWATITGNLANSFRHQVDGLSIQKVEADIDPETQKPTLDFPSD